MTSADTFADSIGVNTHTSYNSGGVGVYYADTDRLPVLLSQLGIRCVRDSHQQGRADQRATLRKLTDAGARLTLQQDPRSSGTLDGRMAELAAGLIPGVEALEGPNEFNFSGTTPNFPAGVTAAPPSWLGTLDAFMRALRDQAQLPVYGPSFVGYHSYVWGRYLSGTANIHPYPAGKHPALAETGTWWWDVQNNVGWRGLERSPFVITETGYHNAVNQGGGHTPVPESVAAAYFPPLLIESFRAGALRTFVYELVDQYPDPELDQAESNFGLARHAPPGSPFVLKPQGVAVANMLSVLRRAGTTDDGALLGATVTAPAGVKYAEFRRADSSWVLLFWQTANLWDVSARSALPTPDPLTVGIALPTSMATSKTIIQDTATATSLGRRASVTLTIPADKTIAFACRP